MQRISKSGLLKPGILAATLLALGGCVYGPGYGYVRGDGYSGDAYYGTEYYRGPAYYDNDPFGYSYYGYGPTFGLGFYYDGYHHRHYYQGPHGGWGGGSWHGHDGGGHAPGGYAHSGHAMPSRGVHGPSGGARMSAPAHASSRGGH
ncbi:MAG: hypothetical protein ABI843_03255 [Dokdonella sp.]